MTELGEIALSIAINAGVAYMILRTEYLKVKKHAEWKEKISEMERQPLPHPKNSKK